MTTSSKENLSALLLVALAIGALVASRVVTSRSPETADAGEFSCEIALTATLPVAGLEQLSELVIRVERRRRSAHRAPDTTDHIERLGWTFAEIARHSGEVAYYDLAGHAAQCIEKRSPGSLAALLLQGHVDHNRHEFAFAEQAARRLVEERGAWFDYALLGDALVEQGQLGEGARAWQTMMDLRPGPQAFSRAAHLRWLSGDVDGALEMAVLASRSISSLSPLASATAHTDIARYLLRAGRSSDAQHVINAALDIAPDNPRVLAVQGRIYQSLGAHAEAVEVLSRLVEQRPSPESQWALLESLKTSGRFDEADRLHADIVRRGAQHDPRTTAVYLATTGADPDEALRLASAELVVRQDALTLDAMAWALAANGRHREAREYSRRARAQGLRDPRLFFHAAAILSAAGDDTSAMTWLSRAEDGRDLLLPSEQKQFDDLRSYLNARSDRGTTQFDSLHTQKAI